MKYYNLFFLLCFSICSFGQVAISDAEYFWDTDPGEGNGIAFSATNGNFNNTLEEILESGIAVPVTGLHTFNVRLKNSNNIWGPIFTQVIDISSAVVGQSVTLVDAEYFWDTDPGEGNGIAFSATDNNFDNALEYLSESTLDIINPIGVHTFNVRVKNSNNTWGPVFTQVIGVETTLSITENSFGEKIILVPNPSYSVTNIMLGSQYAEIQLQVTNMLGKQIFKTSYDNIDTIRLNTDNYTKGVYLITVISEKKKATIKLIVKK